MMMMMEGSVRCSANYVPLTPISFLERSAIVCRDRPSLVYGDATHTWNQTHQRCTKLASAISQLAVSRGDVLRRGTETEKFSDFFIPEKKISCISVPSKSGDSEDRIWRQESPVVVRPPFNHGPPPINAGRCRSTIYGGGQQKLMSVPVSTTKYDLEVAVLAPNIPAMYELHFGVPMSGAVLCTLNTRHDSAMVALLLRHSEAKLLFVDYQLLDIAKGALEIMSKTTTKLPLLVLILECGQPSPGTGDNSPSPGTLIYEDLIAKGSLEFEVRRPRDEWDPISLNYTSGTTSSPKGVIYSHRGAYLNALATVLLNEMRSMPVYLWCVPMFHCNGWCLPWGIAAQGGTNVCQRSVTAEGIFDNIFRHKVTHMGGAPTVLNMIINSPPEVQKPVPGKVAVITGGAPPPPDVLFRMEQLGFILTHSYGLTETYGPGSVCTWKPEWDSLPRDAQAKIKARQGVHHLGMEELDIKDPVTMKSAPADAKTIGEVMFRGNTVMNGYLKDLKATQDAFKGGWLRSGDLGVKHPDGYIELKDRSKDIIISGGENISTIELEGVIFSHPAVLEAAVVGRPDDHWGETPCAFVKLKEGHSATAEEIIQFCRNRLPHYMAPRTVVFAQLPKTSTGKTQKYILREKAKAMGSLSKKNISRL